MNEIWSGDDPTICQICLDEITEAFVDGKTRNGSWAILCPICALLEGCQLGLGKGQLYELQENGPYIKIG